MYLESKVNSPYFNISSLRYMRNIQVKMPITNFICESMVSRRGLGDRNLRKPVYSLKSNDNLEKVYTKRRQDLKKISNQFYHSSGGGKATKEDSEMTRDIEKNSKKYLWSHMWVEGWDQKYWILLTGAVKQSYWFPVLTTSSYQYSLHQYLIFLDFRK